MPTYTSVAAAVGFDDLPEAILNIYSTDIMHNAQGVMMYEEFAVKKTELMRAAGQSITFTRYNDITRGGPLTESVEIDAKSMSASQFSVTMTEYGNAIGITEKLLRMSFDDNMAEAAMLLGRDYAEVRDLSIRNAVVAGGSTLFARESASSLGDIADTDVLDIETIRLGLELLANSNTPEFRTGSDKFFVCFVSPHQAAYLMRDPDWVEAHRYAGSRNLFNGELGRWQNVVFVQTTHQGNGAVASTAAGYEAALDGTGKSGANLYRATLFGDQAYCVGDALPVEMRDGGIKDFGRRHELAWYGIWGQGVLNTNHIVHLISG